MKAKKKPIEEIKVEDLKVDTSPKLEILKVEEPSKRESGEMVKSVDDLLNKLKNTSKVI